MKIALCSVHYNAYSETFIQAHKSLLRDEVSYYHTGWVPRCLEEERIVPSKYSVSGILSYLLWKTGLRKFSPQEQGFMNSLMRTKPDVVLAEYALCGAEILRVVKQLGIPLVIHCHGFDVSEVNTVNTYSKKYKEAFLYADAVIGVSKKMCSMIEELGCPAGKIHYTCCGPRMEFLQLNPEYNGDYALAVGRFVEKKGPLKTILAFARVLEKFPNAKLRFVGDGDLLPAAKKLVQDMHLEHAVTFCGSLSQDEIRELMRSALVFVQHSLRAGNGDMEGTPVAVLEAQAAGLPVVSTIHAGIPDIVIHGETGLLCEEGDVNGMAENMAALFGDRQLAIAMGKKGRERIRDNFTIEKHIHTLQGILNKAARR